MTEQVNISQKFKTVTVFTDPGHAWGKVSKKNLEKLGLLDKISEYSYENKEMIFLEEDCDLGLYVKALENKGYKVKFKEFNTNRSSKIRNFNRYVKK